MAKSSMYASAGTTGGDPALENFAGTYLAYDPLGVGQSSTVPYDPATSSGPSALQRILGATPNPQVGSGKTPPSAAFGGPTAGFGDSLTGFADNFGRPIALFLIALVCIGVGLAAILRS